MRKGSGLREPSRCWRRLSNSAVSATTTFKAVAYASGLTNSSVATAVYNILTATPSFSPVGGNYTTAQTVTLSTATAGASIRYTLDGSTPSDTVGTVYSGRPSAYTVY